MRSSVSTRAERRKNAPMPSKIATYSYPPRFSGSLPIEFLT